MISVLYFGFLCLSSIKKYINIFPNPDNREICYSAILIDWL